LNKFTLRNYDIITIIVMSGHEKKAWKDWIATARQGGSQRAVPYRSSFASIYYLIDVREPVREVLPRLHVLPLLPAFENANDCIYSIPTPGMEHTRITSVSVL